MGKKSERIDNYTREWLNLIEDGGVASVVSYVGYKNMDIAEYDGKYDGSFSASLGISDCSRRIELDFSLYGHYDNDESDNDEIRNIRHKKSQK